MRHQSLFLGILLLGLMVINIMTFRVAPDWMIVVTALISVVIYWWTSFVLFYGYAPNISWLVPSSIKTPAKRASGSIREQLHANAPGKKPTTETEIQLFEQQNRAAQTQTNIPQTVGEPLKVVSNSPWGSSPDVRSAREILFAHIAQERENLIQRNASDEIIRYFDQFSARLAARFDKQ